MTRRHAALRSSVSVMMDEPPGGGTGFSAMPKPIILTETEIELLREACSAKGGVIRIRDDVDIQARLQRTACAHQLARLGYFEAIDGGWRIKPALRKAVAKVLREYDGA